MKRSSVLLLALVLIGAFGLVGCANPADEAPDAVVEEVAETPPAETESEGTVDGTTYPIAEDSTVGFVGSKVTGSHDGGFNTVTGEVVVAGDSAAGGSVKVIIDTTSMWSDNDDLTNHLKSADFFDVETYPTATFTSTSVEAAEEGGFTVTGNLELHGVTKQISFPAAIEMTDGGVTATAEFSIKRFDFGIEYPGRADDLIRDDVLVKFDIRAGAAAAAEPAANDVAA